MIGKGDIVPTGVRLRDLDDFSALREDTFNSVAEGFKKRFPQEYGKYRLELDDVHYADKGEYDLVQQKNALMKNQFLGNRLRGTFSLYDRDQGGLIEKKKVTLMRVPYVTDRGTMIHNGNEYVTLNQARLSSGIYTRKKESGEIEAHINAKRGTGKSYRLRLEPETSLYKMDIDQASLRLYSLLHDIGVPDDDLELRWGPEVLQANKAKYDSRVLDKAYSKLVRNGDPDASREDKVTAVRNALQLTKLSKSSVERTLPNLFNEKAASVWRKFGFQAPAAPQQPFSMAQNSEEFVKWDQKRQELEDKAKKKQEQAEFKRDLEVRRKKLEIQGLNSDLLNESGQLDPHAVVKQVMQNMHNKQKTERAIKTKKVTKDLKHQNKKHVEKIKAEDKLQDKFHDIKDRADQERLEQERERVLGRIRQSLPQQQIPEQPPLQDMMQQQPEMGMPQQPMMPKMAGVMPDWDQYNEEDSLHSKAKKLYSSEVQKAILGMRHELTEGGLADKDIDAELDARRHMIEYLADQAVLNKYPKFPMLPTTPEYSDTAYDTYQLLLSRGVEEEEAKKISMGHGYMPKAAGAKEPNWSHPDLMQLDDSLFFAEKSKSPPIPEENWGDSREEHFSSLGFSNIEADGFGNYYMIDGNGNPLFWDHETNQLLDARPHLGKEAMFNPISAAFRHKKKIYGAHELTDEELARLEEEEELAAQEAEEEEERRKSSAVEPGSALDELIKAKNESDNKQYHHKQVRLRTLMNKNPKDFVITTREEGIVGVTHSPTGFRLHLPKHVVADLDIKDESQVDIRDQAMGILGLGDTKAAASIDGAAINLEAPNYRPSESADKTCGTCQHRTNVGHCNAFNFSCVKDNTCDAWVENTIKYARKGKYRQNPEAENVYLHTKTLKNGHEVDIVKLNDLVGGRDTESIAPERLSTNGANRSKRTGFGSKRYEEADTTKPILVDEDNDIIDGRHRYYKLLDSDADSINIIRVTDEDVAKCYTDNNQPDSESSTKQ